MRTIHEETVRQLFKEIDNDDSNMITLDEFEAHWNSEECAAFFATLDIEADQAWELFRLLDRDGGGQIDVEEFVHGCLHLNGNATAMHAANLTRMSTAMDSRLARLRQDQKKQSQDIQAVHCQLHSIHSSILEMQSNNFTTPWESPLPMSNQ